MYILGHRKKQQFSIPYFINVLSFQNSDYQLYNKCVSRSHDREHRKEEDHQSSAKETFHSESKLKEADELIYSFISFITNFPQADSVDL